MKIAIVGAGFAGLATAWHCLHHLLEKEVHVTLFDHKGIGKGASGIAGGLLHPYAGAHAKRAWNAKEGMEETSFLLKAASTAIGKPVALHSGILRPAITAEQKQDFFSTAALYDDVEWWDEKRCAQAYPELLSYPGLFIKSGVAIDCALYLEGLFQACTQKGLTFVKRPITSLNDLPEYDRVVFACGKGIGDIKEAKELKIHFTRGQLLLLRWENTIPPLPFPIISEKYITFGSEKDILIAGATYERKWATEYVSLEVAEKEIREKIALFAPRLAALPLIEHRSAFRAWIPSHKPCIIPIGPKHWYVGALGSKGLLYHGLIGKEMAVTLFST